MPMPNWIGSCSSVANSWFMYSTLEPTMAAARIACRQAVADELVRLSAGIDHSLRCGFEETVDQENGVERQACLGKLGRAAHVDEHADDVMLLADIDTLAVTDE